MGLRLHALKHEEGAAAKLLTEMKRRLKSGDHADTVRAALEKAMNYLENNIGRTEYTLARGGRTAHRQRGHGGGLQTHHQNSACAAAA